MDPRRWPLWFVLLPLAASGCATRADFLQLKQELRETRAVVADQQVAVDGLRRRMEILRGDVGGGKGGQAASSTLVQRMNSLDARVTALEDRRGGYVPPAPPSTPVPTATETPVAAEPPAQELEAEATPRPAAGGGMEGALSREEASLPEGPVETEYREALALVRAGKCNQAVPKLRDLIRRNPKNAIADNAQYWIGSCYYSQRDYSRAIIELNDLVLKYPKGDKVPGGLLLMADAFADSGDKIDARLVLQKLISQHGSAPEAEQARRKLQTLGE